VVSESRVTCATSVSILIFLGLSVLQLGQMSPTDRQTDRQTSDKKHRLMPPPYGSGGIIIFIHQINGRQEKNTEKKLNLTKKTIMPYLYQSIKS